MEAGPDRADNFVDFCRVCRCEASPSRPLFYPCLCTGSIRYVHQDCLVQWLEYSKRNSCEVCGHSFAFKPVYAPDTPRFLPLKVLLLGLLERGYRLSLKWLHFSFVIFSWIIFVPLVVCRIYRALFTGSISSLFISPVDMFSLDRLIQDCLQGLTLVLIVLAGFLGYVWLREHVLQNGGPQWLNELVDNNVNVANQQDEPHFLPEVDPGEEANQQQDIGNNDPVPRARPPPMFEDDDMGQPVGIEAMNWDRLLGLDGSLAFIEHVLWLMALNTLFIIIFAFCPFHLGHFTIVSLRLEKAVESTKLTNVVTTFLGYVLLATILLLSHLLLKFAGMYRAGRLAGLCYIYIKIALLFVVELAIFPVFCGIWINICSLQMFNATLKQRLQLFFYSPAAFVCMHWIKGMLFVFYMASLVVASKSVLRPGLLSLVQQLTSPDYKPIRSVITNPLPVYIQELIISYCLTGILVVFTLWVPALIIRRFHTGFLPLRLQRAFDSPFDYSLEILVVQILVPFLINQSLRHVVSALIKYWCIGVAWLLDLRSYLIGDVEFQPGDTIVMEDGREVPAAAGTPGRPPRTPAVDEANNEELQYAPYKKTRHFHCKLVALVALLLATWTAVSCLLIVLPISVGRGVLGRFQKLNQLHSGDIVVFYPSTVASNHSDGEKKSATSGHDVLCLITGVAIIAGLFQLFVQGKRLLDRLPDWRGQGRGLCSSCARVFNRIMQIGQNFLQWLIWTMPNHAQRRHNQPPRMTTQLALASDQMTASASSEIYDAIVAPHQTPGPVNTMDFSLVEVPREESLTLCQRVLIAGLEQGLRVLPTLRVAGRVAHLVFIVAVLGVLFPIMAGLVLELTFLTPFRVAPRKSIIIDVCENWIFGFKFLHGFIFLFITMGRENFGILDAMEDLMAQQRMRLRRVEMLWPQVAPWISPTGLILTLPYICSHHVAPLLGLEPTIVFRYAYPLQVLFITLGYFAHRQIKRWTAIYESIKNEHYLVGRVLVNLHRQSDPAAAAQVEIAHAHQ